MAEKDYTYKQERLARYAQDECFFGQPDAVLQQGFLADGVFAPCFLNTIK